MAPIGVGEDGKLPTVDDALNLGLNILEVARRGITPGGYALLYGRGLVGIGLERGDDIHPVEGVQVIEVHHMIVYILLCDHEVAHQVGRLGDLNAQGVFHGADGGEGMHRCAYSARPLCESPCLPGVAALQDDLDSPHHGAGGIGLGDRVAGIQLGLDTQVALDAGDRINN